MNTLYLRIKELASGRKESLAEIERNLKFSNGIISTWKNGNASSDKLEKVADYFGVSADYLLGRTDNPSLDSDHDLEVEEALNSMRSYQGKPVSDSEREVLRGIIKAYLDSQDKGK